MKTVLFIIDSLICGGAEKSLVSLLPLLDYTKLDVSLMMVARGGVFESYIPKEVKVIPFPEIKGWGRLSRFLFSLLLRLMPHRHGAELRWMAMHEAYPECKQEYDVAVAYQQGFPTYFVAEKVKAARKYAWINADIRKAGYRPAYNRRFYNGMSKVIAVSDTLYEMLCDDSYVKKNKLLVVRDIVNVDLITQMALGKGFDDNVDNGVLRIVTVGRLARPKNYLLAVETAKLLKEQGLSFHWYFIGEGNERIAIEERIKEYGLQDKVLLLGMQSNPYPYMRQCDIYVQTSLFEGFGLTISEAMILHKPIVSTNFTVVHDQIKDGVNGLISEMIPESLCRSIMRLAEDEGLRQRLIEGTYSIKNHTALTESAKVNILLMS